MQVNFTGNGVMNISGIPAFNSKYLRQLIRTRSFMPLQPLFEVAQDPAKEWTESYSALHHLQPWIDEMRLALHIGDGKHARTAAMFAFNTPHINVAIDPAIDPERLERWREKYGVRRFSFIPKKAEEEAARAVDLFGHAIPAPAVLTFVHAHVNTTEILESLPAGSWAAAYICACCDHRRQLVRDDHPTIKVLEHKEDWAVLSPQRTYQVLVPRTAGENEFSATTPKVGHV